MSDQPPLSQTYYVWARNKYDAIEKAVALADGKGWQVYHTEAKRFPAGKDYKVNWSVEVFIEQGDGR